LYLKPVDYGVQILSMICKSTDTWTIVLNAMVSEDHGTLTLGGVQVYHLPCILAGEGALVMGNMFPFLMTKEYHKSWMWYNPLQELLKKEREHLRP